MSDKRKDRRVQGGWSANSCGHMERSVEQKSTYLFAQPNKMPSKKPSNFSWLVEGVLAGSAYPSSREHFQYFKNQGISHVVTLTQWKPDARTIPPGMSMVFMPVEEFEAPCLKQMQDFVEVVEKARQKNEAIVTHCHWGRGRTGTMLAAYLVKHHNMTPQEAITEVRAKRPMSIETQEQENVIFEYAQLLESQKQTNASSCTTKEQNGHGN